MIGVSRIPNGVKFKINPISGTIAMLRPNESATRSIPSIPDSDVSVSLSSVSLLSVVPSGNSAAMNKYPGMNRTNGSPSPARIGVSRIPGRRIARHITLRYTKMSLKSAGSVRTERGKTIRTIS